jgi:hypothetical protein
MPLVMHDAWKRGNQVNDLGDVVANLHGVMISLKRWSRKNFRAVTLELEQPRQKLEELGDQDTDHAREKGKEIQNRMDKLLYREEMMWLQRSQISWLKEGDRNTKFFSSQGKGKYDQEVVGEC